MLHDLIQMRTLKNNTHFGWQLWELGGCMRELGKGVQNVSTSKINKFWGCNAQHDDNI